MMTRPQEMIDAAKAMNEYQVARLKADETLSRLRENLERIEAELARTAD
jgi:hypothetical protein